MAEMQRFQLKNGTRVIFVPHADTAAVTLLALFEVGSRYETDAQSGASHFIEHMMFKGTEKRPSTMTISRDLDAVGAEYNAYTGKDHTGYYIRLQAAKLPLAADMLSDMLYASLYRENDLNSERQVIQEEIKMYEDNPLMLVEELYEQEQFGGSPLGRAIAGTHESMNGLKRDALIKYRDAYYVPQRTVLALAGKFDPEAAHQLLEEKFGGRPRRPDPATFVKCRPIVRAPRIHLKVKETEQVTAALGFPAFPYGDKRLPALNMLSIILGGNMSSRLFLSVREKAGLAYFIGSGVGVYQDTGNFVVQAGLSRDKVHQACDLIMKELLRIREKTVGAAELRRAKDYLRGRLTLSMEDSSRLADWYAKQELLQRRADSPAVRLARIDKVTAEEVRAVAADLIQRKRLTLAVIGPDKDSSAYAKHAMKI